MSVVCGKVYDDRIEIASDSGLFLGDLVLPCKSGEEKLIKIKTCYNKEIIIGGVGSFSQGVLLRDFLDHYEEDIEPTVSGMIDLFTTFYQYATTLRASDELLKRSEEDADAFIVVIDKKMFYVSGLDIFEVDNYMAIGAGQPYALAALACGASPVEAVKKAIDLCVFLREPIIHYEVMK